MTEPKAAPDGELAKARQHHGHDEFDDFKTDCGNQGAAQQCFFLRLMSWQNPKDP